MNLPYLSYKWQRFYKNKPSFEWVANKKGFDRAGGNRDQVKPNPESV
jgi:hypothetical protein